MTMRIASMDQWKMLSEQGLDVVVDPMVVRCGEIFLKGQAGARDPAQGWGLLERNIGALTLFFDALILEDRIPVFNYGDTFDAQLDFDARVLSAVNDAERVLYDVTVEYAPYMEVKAAAMAELRKLYAGTHKIHRDMAEDIVSEMAAAEYQWSPNLHELDQELPSELEKKLARFFLGGLIFGAYAQLLGGRHVIQPKRSRLFLAASLNKPPNHRFEDELFGELKRRARSSVTELPWQPTFFPYLLSEADAPESLLSRALQLRQSSEVRDYRAWLREAMAHWDMHGHLGPAARDIAKIAAAVDARIAGKSALPKVEVKVDVADVVGVAAGAPKLPGSIDFTPTLEALWGWWISSLPGRRYRKLLMRSTTADATYRQIENRIRAVWSASGEARPRTVALPA